MVTKTTKITRSSVIAKDTKGLYLISDRAPPGCSNVSALFLVEGVISL